ncbi:MAG: hypothetical protein AB7H97_00660 [Pseudobdellovibrionaceae bacterium]
MKFISALIISLICSVAGAEVPSSQIYKQKFTFEEAGGQAAVLVDPAHVTTLWEKMAQEDPEIRALLKEMETIYECPVDAPEFCGRLNIPGPSNTVLLSYARGGWANAGGVYRSTLTYTMAGTGRITEPIADLEISIIVRAEDLKEGEEVPKYFDVTVRLEKMVRFPPDKHLVK